MSSLKESQNSYLKCHQAIKQQLELILKYQKSKLTMELETGGNIKWLI